MKFKFSKSAALVFGALAFAAIGCGGGHDHHHHHDDPDEPEEDTVLIDLQVIDGYLKDAMVFIDLNRNFEWDTNEPRGYADSYGMTHLSVWKDDLRSRGDTPLQVIARSSSGASNYIYGEKDTTERDMVMSRNIFVNRDMNDGVWYIISPFSTLTDIELSGTGDFDDFYAYRSRLAELAADAGASEKTVYDSDDYNVSLRNEDDLRTEAAGEVLARKGKLPATFAELKERMNALSGESQDYDLSDCRELTEEIVSKAQEDMKDNDKYSGKELIATIKSVLNKKDDKDTTSDDFSEQDADDADSFFADDDQSSSTDEENAESEHRPDNEEILKKLKDDPDYREFFRQLKCSYPYGQPNTDPECAVADDEENTESAQCT
ncbi:MAG: hypothetical protein VZR11_05595 [Succinimonas sp.]|nr:hypothetical protein [Succinimonas sp.]